MIGKKWPRLQWIDDNVSGNLVPFATTKINIVSLVSVSTTSIKAIIGGSG